MTDNFRYFLYSIGKNKTVNYLYIQYYKIALFLMAFLIKRLSFVEHLYLKGSFGTKDFIPVISDLDFFIIGETNRKNINVVEKIFKVMNSLFPMVSDYDFHSQYEAQYLKRFSGMKYFSTSNWTVLKGEPFKFDYQFYPRKFYVDIVHEIYFQIEWVFKNLRHRKPGDKLKSICLHRQYEKIVDLINYLGNNNDSFELYRREFTENKRWIAFSNEDIIRKFNNYLEQSKVLATFKEIYKYEFHDRKIDEILKEEYFRTQLVLYKENFNYHGKLHYFTENNFELFYFSGCIDSYLLWDWCEFTNDKVGRLYLKNLYYTRLLEKRGNSKHDYKFYLNNLHDVEHLQKLVTQTFHNNSPLMTNFFNKNVIVSTLVEQEIREQKTEVLGFKNFNIHLVSLSESLQKKTLIPTLHILEKELSSDLEYKMSLLNIGIHWCFGARVVVLSNMNQLDANKIDSNEIIDDCNSGLFVNLNTSRPNVFSWAATYLQFRRIHKLVDTSFGYGESDLFKYQISSDLTKGLEVNYIVDRLDIFGTEDHKYIDLRDQNLNDHLIHDEFDLGILSLLSNGIEHNEYGLIHKKSNPNEYWGKLQYLKDAARATQKYELLGVAEEVIYNKDHKTINFLELTTSEYWRLVGIGVILESSLTSLKLRTGNTLEQLPFIINYNSTISRENKNKILYEKKTIDGEVTDKSIALSIIEKSGTSSDYVINYSGDDVYSMESIYVVSEDGNSVSYKYKANLNQATTYSINVDNSKFYSLDDDTNCEFYKKEIGAIENYRFPLNSLHRGLYKLVITISSPLTGKLYITNSKTKSRFQNLFFENSKVCIMYLLVTKESKEYVVNFPSDTKITSSIEIDFLKAKDFT